MVRTQCALPFMAAIIAGCFGYGTSYRSASAYLFETPPWLNTSEPRQGSPSAASSTPAPSAPTSPSSSITSNPVSCLTAPGSPVLGIWRYHSTKDGRRCWYATAPRSTPQVAQESRAAAPAEAAQAIPQFPLLYPYYPPTALPDSFLPPVAGQGSQGDTKGGVTVISKTSSSIQQPEADVPPPPRIMPAPDVIRELPPARAIRLNSMWVLLPSLFLFQAMIATIIWRVISRPSRKHLYARN